MTFKIIKAREIAKANKEITSVVVEALIDGMINDSVFDIHTAVEAANAASEIDQRDFCGDNISATYTQLLEELKHLNDMADSELRRTGSIVDAGTAIRELETNFKYSDIKTMKAEIYGSTKEWKKAMTAPEA